jgi:phosphate transport system substrate-binding protein
MGSVVLLAVGSLGMAGCGNQAVAPGTPGVEAADGSTTPPPGTVRMAGAEGMVSLAQAWADGYTSENSDVTITVKVAGGGSDAGIAALISGKVEFADSSREMTPDEIAKAKAAGVDPLATKIARDGIAVIVNPANTVTGLTKDQLGRIYTGAITNWKELGGPDKVIKLVMTGASSATHELMTLDVLGGGAFASSTKLLESNQAVADAVAADPDAIGCIGAGFDATSVTVLGIDGVQGTADTVMNGTYPLSRVLYLYSNGTPTGVGKAFLDWIIAAEGQQVVADQGFVPVE